LGLPPASSIARLLQAINSADSPQTLQALEQLWEQGANPSVIAAELAKLLRQEILDKTPSAWSIKLLKQLLVVPSSPRPRDQLEIAALEAANRASLYNLKTPDRVDPKKNSRHAKSRSTVVTRPVEIAASPSRTIPVIKKTAVKDKTPTFSLAQWQDLVMEVKTMRASLYTALRLASPKIEGHTLTLAFRFPLHQRKVNQPTHRKLLEELVAAKAGGRMKVVGIVDKTAHRQSRIKPRAIKNEVVEAETLQTISSIFGQAEMLES
jgi:DNA polymerase III gamma/tau subunit